MGCAIKQSGAVQELQKAGFEKLACRKKRGCCVSWLSPRKRALNLFSNEDLLEKSHSKYQARHQAVLWSHCPQISETVCIGHFVIYTGNHSFPAETEEVK